jgi:homopolymeric O-antigen transport system permease protein
MNPQKGFMAFARYVFGSKFNKRRKAYLWDLLVHLTIRDLKVRYEGSTLGFAWSLANPLLLLCVFYFLFQMVLSVDVRRFSSFTFTGILIWYWFSSSLTQAATSITASRELIRRPGFPIAVLPVVSVSGALLHFLLSLPVLLLLIFLEGAGLRLTIFAFPFVILIQFVLLLGFGYLVAAANVLFRDTSHMLTGLLQVLFFLTPIFYDPSVVPVAYRPFYNLNPLVHLMEASRDVLLRGILPNALPLIVLSVIAIGLLYFGLKAFFRVSYRFVEEL